MDKQEIKVNTIYNQDCIQGMKRMCQNSVDLIITDPPFAIGFRAEKSNYNRRQDRVIEGYNEIEVDKYLDFSIEWIRESYRILKPSGSAFIFSGWNNLKDILIAIDKCGFITVNHIIWKYQFGVVCKRRFVTSHYHCLFLCKDDKKRKFNNNARYNKDDKTNNGRSLRYRDMEDVWYIKREYWRGNKKTPTKLPTEIIEKILMYVSEPNDIVFDPFLGSGQVAIVSKTHNRKYIGFEIVKEYYDFALSRLSNNTYQIP